MIEYAGIDQAITENGNELSRKQFLIYLLENKKYESSLLQEKVKDELAAVNEKMENLKIKHKYDTEILDSYLSIGREQFLKQQSEIIANINSEEALATEKTMYLLLLSLIDKDYSIICERGNLNE
ncbi:MAG: hypothetical protein NC485_10780 [Ruminococcus flavefaciens]|nr:hypothetical protein [Ruminococcus flavefaciens]MCM1060906.1 hypothetical protein [Eubacterium sp.]